MSEQNDFGLSAHLDLADWEAAWTKFLTEQDQMASASQKTADAVTQAFDQVDKSSDKLEEHTGTLNKAFTSMLDDIEKGTDATKAAALATADVVDQATKGTGPLEDAYKRVKDGAESAGQSGKETGKGFAEGADEGHAALTQFLSVLEKIPGIGPGIHEVLTEFEGVGQAGEAAAALIETSWAPLILTIGAVVAVLGAVVVAAALAGDAVQQAVKQAEEINKIELTLGTNAEVSQDIATTADVADVGIQTVERGFESMNAAAQNATDKAAAGLIKTGQAADDTGKQLSRLGEDYTRNVANVIESASQRLDDIERTRAKLNTTFYSQEAEKQEEFDKTQKENAQRLQQQLEDLSRQHAKTIADLKQQMSDLTDTFEQQQADRQQKLQDDLAKLTEGYESKKDSINAKYYAPRSARERAARDEELALLEKQYGAEQDQLKKRATTEEERAQEAFDKHRSAIQRQIDSDNEQYTRQTARLKEEDDRRVRDATDAFNEQKAIALKSYNDQLDAFKLQNTRIKEEEDKRLEDLKRSYDRALTDIGERTARAASTGTTGLSGLEKGFKALNIDLEAWNKLDAAGKIEAFGTALDKIKDPVERMNILREIFGARQAEAMALFFQVWSSGVANIKPPLTQKDIDNLVALGRLQRLTNDQFHDLAVTMGTYLAPAWMEFTTQLQAIIINHGPELLTLFDKVTKVVVPALISIIDDLAGQFNTTTGTITNTKTGFLGGLIAADSGIGQFLTALDNIGKGLDAVAKWIDNVGIEFHNAIQANGSWGLFFEFANTLFKLLLDITGIKVPGVNSPVVTFYPQTPDTYNPTPTVSNRHYAAGGIALAGVPAWVGELGPEQIIPLQDSLIIPAASSRQMGTTYNVTIQASTYEGGRAASRGFVDGMKSRGIMIIGGNG